MSDQGFDIHSRTVAKPAAKKFNRHITGSELIAACAKEDFPCFPYSYLKGHCYLKGHSDRIRFGFQHGTTFVDALYSVVNGRAFGTYWVGITGTAQRTEFDTDDKLDGTPWFDALLAFLYRE